MSTSRKPRRYPRIELPKGMLVAWQSAAYREVSPAHTVGLGGLYIVTKHPAPVDTVLKLLFDVPGGEVRARAVVRSSHAGKGMGVEFIVMGSEDRARLNQLLKRLLEVVA